MRNFVITSRCLIGIVLAFAGSALAQDGDGFLRIDGQPGQKVPKSLLAVVSVHLDQVDFEDALSVLSKKANLKLSFNRNRIPVHQKITVNMADTYALEVMLHILEKTKTELLVTKDGNLLIVPKKDRGRLFGTITGEVVDGKTGHPLPYTNIMVVATSLGGISDDAGAFVLDNIPTGEHSLQFSFIGYETEKIDQVSVKANSTTDLKVALKPHAISLGEVIVTPGQFSIMGQGPAVKQTLTQRDLQTIPFGEDIYRAVTRLPGISSSDFSAKFTVRGGENQEILLLVDGMELREPFHLKDIEGGALSIIDVAAIQGIDLLSGGFPAEYGDRMSGVFNIKTRSASSGQKRTSLGLSFMNARIMSQGSIRNNRGSWLFSARRGYLDLVMDLMGETDPPRPVYYDVLGKVSYGLNRNHTLSAHFLHAGDKLDFVEEDNDIDKTRYGNTYSWLTLKSFPSTRLLVQSMLSYSRLSHGRQGIGFDGDSDMIEFKVSDDRHVDILGAKQDWNFELNDNMQLKWGFDLKSLASDYAYLSSQRYQTQDESGQESVVNDTNRVDLQPSGTRFGAFLSNRIRIIKPLVAEFGLRYDNNSITKDDLISPRLNFVYELGDQTFLRAGWGHFYQSQGIHEMKVSFGENGFHPAERAEHWVGGFEHTFRNGFNLRFEGYYKKLSSLRPDYRDFSSDIEIFPEMQHNRYKLIFSGARSKGIEAYLKYDRGGRFSWWASYALAHADENIRSLVFSGIPFPGGDQLFPGRFDQRHTVYLDMNYRPNRNWHFNISWQFHSGWPYTAKSIRSRQLDDGSVTYFDTYDRYNGSNYPAYHRFDLRVNRHFYTSNGRISAFISLINLYNHGNVRGISYRWKWQNNRPSLTEDNEYWFKRLPSIGLTWDFDH